MKQPSKGLKITVLVASFGLLAAYVLYASSIIKLGGQQVAGLSMAGSASDKVSDVPSFKLPYWVRKDYNDTMKVVAYKLLPDNPDKVLILAVPDNAQIRELDHVRMMSSKSSVQPIILHTKTERADSMLISSDWTKKDSEQPYLPPLYRERFWMMSSKAAPLDEPEPSEAEKEQAAAYLQLASTPWTNIPPGSPLLVKPATKKSPEQNNAPNQNANINNANDR
jgi:hypothetical protein